MDLTELSAVLWKERHLLELLLFKLETEQLLLAAGRSRWLARASGEVEMVLGELKHVALERAVATTGIATALGLGSDASLRELAEAAPPPWRNLLADHRFAFLALTGDVSEVVRTNRDLLGRGQRSLHAEGYFSQRVDMLPATVVELQLTDVAYQAALGATAKVIQPSLVDFLR